MFYSQFILAKKGPLGTIWIAAHLERKLRKNQVADTDIGVSVDSILSPDVPIALRLSSHLLLGVVRIYNRKVNYLFDDCSEALLKVKQAFRSAAVDLPPEESKAPYHSITLPETFDLDDFELPDNDMGHFVDHHISSREQITLQDTMEGVSYSTSKFGLDERFGDGDASGLDLDEELFLGKIEAARPANESFDPQASVGDEHPETSNVNFGTRIGGHDGYTDLMDYAQAPCTPGLVEEPNVSNVQEVSACDEHLETEYHLVESTVRENATDNNYRDIVNINECSPNNTTSEAIPIVLTEENGYHSGGLDINLSKPHGESPIEAKLTSDLQGQVTAPSPASELADNIVEACDTPCLDDLQNGIANKDNNSSLPFGKPSDDNQGPLDTALEKTSVLAKDDGTLAVGVFDCVEVASDVEKLCTDVSDPAFKDQDGSGPQNLETQFCHEPTEKVECTEPIFLRPCNFNVERPDRTSGCDMSIQAEVAVSETSGREETEMPGQECCKTDNLEEDLKENHVQDNSALEDIHAASHDGLVEKLSTSEAELAAPEKLLSVPVGPADLHRNTLLEGSPGVLVRLDEADAVSGKKRTFTESTLTEQSHNSVESSRLARFKGTVGSVPDDDDLLSSILVGRSSVLKVKPTPRLSEVTSIKRTRTTPRTGAPKRKMLMDDTMVLHGDTIRQQLTNTEDIRRVRKKAPCTGPEISMIQRQFLEDEIFVEPISTGMSFELVSLHSQMRDLSEIAVCKNEANGTSLEIVAELSLPSENVVLLGTMAEPMSPSHDPKNDDFLAGAAKPHLTFQNDENGENGDIENDKDSGMPNILEQNGVHLTSELSLERDSEAAKPDENPLVNNNMTDEFEELNVEVNVSEEQTKPTSDLGADHSQQELLLDLTEVEASQKHGDASAGLVQADYITETIETNTCVNADALAVIPDQNIDAPVEFAYAAMGVENGQATNGVDLTDKDSNINIAVGTEPVVRDDILSEVARDGVTVELLSNDKHGELESDQHSNTINVMSEEHVTSSSYPAQVGPLENYFFTNNGENQEQPETYQCQVMDAESSGFDLRDQEELKYSAAGNDTEFLNVDDDELTEIADDHIPDDEDERFTENTGWSSRTRAVSKYLQTLFVKEAESGRRSLSMDKLLIGKSRKEASRMFFEALVLKTRDHIHVEQRNPFDDIALKPRTRLMKSDF